MNDKEQVEKIIKIYDSYPAVTVRVLLQLAFLKRCLGGITMAQYFQERGEKNKDREGILAERVLG